MKHKHAELIKAWADGAKIEFHSHDDVWFLAMKPEWDIEQKYRIKPEPKPDIVMDQYIYVDRGRIYLNADRTANIRYTFSGETGELIKAEVI